MEVWCPQFGHGCISELKSKELRYPIQVAFPSSDRPQGFSAEGKYEMAEAYPTLFYKSPPGYTEVIDGLECLDERIGKLCIFYNKFGDGQLSRPHLNILTKVKGGKFSCITPSGTVVGYTHCEVCTAERYLELAKNSLGL